MRETASKNTRPCVQITKITDAATASANFDFFDQDLLSFTSKYSLDIQQVVLHLDGINLVYYSSNVRVRSRPSLRRSHLGFIVFERDAAGTVNGLPLRNDVIVTVPSGQTVAMVTEPGHKSAGFLVPQSELLAHLSTQGREEVLAGLQRVELRQLEPELAPPLFIWAQHLVSAAVEQPESFNESLERQAAVRSDLLNMLSSTLAASFSVELDRRDRTRLMQSQIVRAAEQYAMENCSERLYVKDLCQAAGVSERTLEYAFRAEMGLSPMSYLLRLRLHKVREALLQSAVIPTTVGSEALHWGFWQMGDFARNYKDCFQELPSETLRRAQSQ